jgi:hypothetical protein
MCDVCVFSGFFRIVSEFHVLSIVIRPFLTHFSFFHCSGHQWSGIRIQYVLFVVVGTVVVA